MKFDRITTEGGQPCIRDTRIPVVSILNLLAEGKSTKDVIKENPELVEEDIRQALGYSAKIIRKMNDRLSSDNLYHFTGKLDAVKGILKEGFRYSHANETLPIDDPNNEQCHRQDSHIVCFSDIKPEDSLFHRECYGNYALVMQKKWAANAGITPVQYIHRNSPIVDQFYRNFKIRVDEINNMVLEDSELDKRSRALCYLIMDIKTYLSEPNGAGKLLNLTRQREVNYNTLEQRFLVKLKDESHIQDFITFQVAYTETILWLYNLLLERDLLSRNYKEDVRCRTGKKIKNKVIYDEREWRALKTRELAEYRDILQESIVAKNEEVKNRHLIFTDNDLCAVLVDTHENVNIIKNYITETPGLLISPKCVDKVHCIDEWDESAAFN